MNSTSKAPPRSVLVIFASLLVVIHLAWEAMNGGVRSHHLLARADYPSISNAWGLLVVPALAWMAGPAFKAFPAFLPSLIYGATLAFSYSMGLGWEKALFYGMFGIALFVPICRPIYVFGFVLGMMAVFGAVLPTIIASVIGVLAWPLRWTLRLMWNAVRRQEAEISGNDRT